VVCNASVEQQREYTIQQHKSKHNNVKVPEVFFHGVAEFRHALNTPSMILNFVLFFIEGNLFLSLSILGVHNM
jgi:hypothetical protein